MSMCIYHGNCAEGRRIREAFIAPPCHRIVSADYSQIELRIMAHLSGDPCAEPGTPPGRRPSAKQIETPPTEGE